MPPHGAGRYLFAYGSLIQREARESTVPGAGRAYPVVVQGLRRGWWFQYGPELGPTLSPTYLAAQPDSAATCNGVIFELPSTGLDALDWREQGYLATALDPAAVEVLTGDASLTGLDLFYYAGQERKPPNATHPIVQTYVDVCVGGCLEIEEEYPEARAASFARQFVATTNDWQPPWVNDRPSPWRPSLHEPRAWDIDALLHDALGPDLFGQIRVPGL